MKNMNENDQGKFVMPGDLILNEERNLEGTYTENVVDVCYVSNGECKMYSKEEIAQILKTL